MRDIARVNPVIEEMELEQIQEQEEDTKRIPPWTKHMTIRGLIVSLAIGINVSAALLAFVFVRTWIKLLHKAGIVSTPFTRQENTIIQTCATACYSIAVGGGFGSYLLGLNRKTYLQAGVDTPGNNPNSTKEPEIGWMTGFLFVTCFVGLLALVPLRKIMVIDYKLTYPSGTATAVLINGFHSSKGNKMAKYILQSSYHLQFMFSQDQNRIGGDLCGFVQFPTFGLKAWKNSFYFDFSMTYIGAGMICSHLVNLSLLLGAVLSWGIMWPLISGLKGEWFPKTLPESSMKSLNGYKVFVSIALILGDGLYNFLKVAYFTGKNIQAARTRNNNINTTSDNQNSQSLHDLQRNEIFIRESIPLWLACVGYIIFSIISIIIIPLMFLQLKWYFVVVAYLLAPILSFCNAYGAGLTDMNMAYNYGKVALFVLAALSGKENGVVAGLVGCGLIKSIVSISSDLMHDFKTGHLTLTSPRSMLLSQAIGTAIGCVVAPLSFFLFYRAFDVGNPDREYKAPYAIVYRNMQFSVFKASPRCLGIACSFVMGAYFAIDMCVGSLIVFVWQKLNKKKADLMIPAVASGLICGDGLWILPSSILALAKIRPPICMKFLAS
ncbi:metal-nicotianamine transporter YSL3 [Citrus sinensis]|nr:metal-nicotianamine transporter YSL3 [Citrus sinensis]